MARMNFAGSVPALRLERDPGFWSAIAVLDEAAGARIGLTAEEVGALALESRVLPLASANGGFLMAQLDALGAVFEAHALFARAGWGREAHGAALGALEALFASGALVITAFELEGRVASRPPRSFGFRRLGPAPEKTLGPAWLWILTRGAWEASPARRRLKKGRACPLP